MSWEYELAKEIKNKPRISNNALIGKVAAAAPLKVSLHEGAVFVTGSALYVSSRVSELVAAEKLAVGDTVLCLSLASGKFAVVDKVGL